MSDAANRLYKILRGDEVNTGSSMIGLTVISTSPVKLTNGDRMILTDDFILFSKMIDTSKITIGDTFLAVVLNNDQLYYILEVVSSTNELYKYANEVELLKQRVSTLESKVTTLQGDVRSLDARVTALENRF